MHPLEPVVVPAPRPAWRAAVTRRLIGLRLRLSGRLRRLLLGPVVGDLPQQVVRSLEERGHQPEIAAHILGSELLEEGHSEYYKLPVSYPIRFRRHWAFTPQRLFTLQDVCVGPRSGVVWLPDGMLLQESVGSLSRLLSWGNALDEVLQPVQRLNTEREVVVHPTTPFYHWLLENLPNTLKLLKARPNAVVLFDSHRRPYMEDALALVLGTAPNRRMYVHGAVRVPRVLLLPQDEVSCFVRPGDLSLLRESFHDVINRPIDADLPTRFYVSRRRTSKRPIQNEAAIEDALRARGLSIVYAEDLAFAQQIQLFAQAQLIVAPHGAGLANLTWCRPGTRVLELFAPDVFNDCYARLSEMLQLNYHYLDSEMPTAVPGCLDVQAMLRALDELEGASGPAT
jgi:Glycosyltransferase 61